MCLAIPGKIVDIREEHGLRAGRIQFGGILRQASLDFRTGLGPAAGGKGARGACGISCGGCPGIGHSGCIP